MQDRFYTPGDNDSRLSVIEPPETDAIYIRTLYKCACCGCINDEDGDEAVPREWDNIEHLPECAWCVLERTEEEFYNED